MKETVPFLFCNAAYWTKENNVDIIFTEIHTERGTSIVKKKILPIIIMLLAVAVTVTAVAFISSWIAPEEEKKDQKSAAKAVAVTVTKDAEEQGAQVQQPVADEKTEEDKGSDQPAIPETVEGTVADEQQVPVQTETPAKPLLDISLIQNVIQTAEPSNPLIGRWQLTEETIEELLGMSDYGDLMLTIEFTENGECITTVSLMGSVESQTVEYLFDNDTLTIDGSVEEYSLDGDRLVITSGDTVMNCVRMPEAN